MADSSFAGRIGKVRFCVRPRGPVWYYDVVLGDRRYRASTGERDRDAAIAFARDKVQRHIKETGVRKNQRQTQFGRVVRSTENPPNHFTKGRVYFIACSVTGNIKIGWATNVESRLRAIQANSPTRLSVIKDVPGWIDTERELHGMFASERLHYEWFTGTPELRAFIESYEGDDRTHEEKFPRLFMSAEELISYAPGSSHG